MKSVAIIGAGPAGLVAAKTLLHSCAKDTFSVSVYEQGKSVGGLWAVASHPAGLINADMNTNLFQFSVCFSDLAWESLDLQPAANVFPKAWQVNRYLEHYARKFVLDGVVALQSYVKNVEQTTADKKSQWRVTYVQLNDGNSNSEKENVAIFDYLIVASGLFTKPQLPTFNLHNITSSPNVNQASILHSSQYRKLSDLFTTGIQPSTGKILIIGGSHSGVEVAAAIALQMSDARYSPTGSGTEPLEIIHVMPYPLVSLPNFVQAGKESWPTFLPLDSTLYDLSHRPDDPISWMYGHITPENTRQLRYLLIKIMEGATSKQDDPDDENSRAAGAASPYAAVSESYVEYVRSAAIRPILGRVLSIEAQTENNHQEAMSLLRAIMSGGSEEVEIQETAAVIYATGFEPTLDFMPEALKNAVGYDVSCPRLPLLLNRNFSTSSDAAPENLALMGFNYGSYWGVLETEARAIARKWASEIAGQSPTSSDPTPGTDEKLSSKLYTFMKEIRSILREDPSSVPQNFFGDYAGLMEQTSRELDLQRVDLSWGAREGMSCPARYIDSGCDRLEAEKTMQKLQKLLDTSTNQRAFAARAAFRGLHGNWTINRLERLDSSIRDDDSVELARTVSFHPRFPTDGISDLEYFVIMKGEGGHTVRSFVYRMCETSNIIGIWNVRENGVANTQVYELEFASATSDAEDCLSVVATVAATSETRDANTMPVYTFCFAGVHVVEFAIERYSEGESVDGGSNIFFTR
ncbi:hypothetical protein CJF31_00006636 [Rutstroemia sp. NJR-2017a BVV2]|nr:hypothetical protein CJF31_00006636 [Rutstroemia sp. NJR-2017a BVV2]